MHCTTDEIDDLCQTAAEVCNVKRIFGIEPATELRRFVEYEVLHEYHSHIRKTDEFQRRVREVIEKMIETKKVSF